MKSIILLFLAAVLAPSSMVSTAYGLVDARSEQVRYTVQKSPVVYYLISHAVPDHLFFRLQHSRAIPPVIDIPIPSPPQPGFWPIRLEDYHIMLEEDVQYWWIVYTIDAEDSNREIIVAQGGIEWIDPHLVQYYGHSCNPEEVRLGLEAGIWYDAFACLNKLMEANPEDDELGELRTRLLRDGGITGR